MPTIAPLHHLCNGTAANIHVYDPLLHLVVNRDADPNKIEDSRVKSGKQGVPTPTFLHKIAFLPFYRRRYQKTRPLHFEGHFDTIATSFNFCEQCSVYV